MPPLGVLPQACNIMHAHAYHDVGRMASNRYSVQQIYGAVGLLRSPRGTGRVTIRLNESSLQKLSVLRAQ